MSGYIHKSRIPTASRSSLPDPASRSLIQAKNTLREGVLSGRFKNYDDSNGGGSPLPKASDGCTYREVDAGSAHPGDPQPRGQWRLVLEIHEPSWTIREVYFTPDHYLKGSFVRLVG